MSEPLFKHRWIPLCISIAIVLGILWGYKGSNNTANIPQNTIIYKQGYNNYTPHSINNIDMLLQVVKSNYVDTVDTKELSYKAMESILKELDPHSEFIRAEDFNVVNDELEGSFSGIGIQFNLLNDTINIVDVISGGPSERCGILPGDRIITVDDSLFVGENVNNDKVMKTLRGPKNSVVKLGIKRRGASDLLQFEVIRGDVPIYSVDAHYMIQPEIGYILISKFGRTTYEEFLIALAELKYQGATGFIIDLRGNGGGYMDASINMVNEFLSSGEPIVYTEGRSFPREMAMANGYGSFQNYPIVVLTDEWSASASEIFAGAIQDNDRGLIIGRRTFGKGLVQNQYPLADGSAVRLTVARYHTPSGRCIQKEYTMGDDENYEMDILNRYNRGEFFNADSIHLHTDDIYTTIGGRTVYGGGGIMPDIFVPSDTSYVTPYYTNIINQSLLYKYAFEYVDNNRTRLSQATNHTELQALLDGNYLLNDFIAYAARNGVQPRYNDINISREAIIRLLQAYIARDVIGDEAFYPIFMSDDNVLEKACSIIKAGEAYPQLPGKN